MGFGALWRARPPHRSRVGWILKLGLDVLPWPWGEDILTYLAAAVFLADTSWRRRALRWASAQPGRRPWRLTVALCVFRGRWVPRSALLGLRGPEDMRPHLTLEGAEHLAATPGGAILLGFHLGPPNADLTLRVLGHQLLWLGGRQRASRGWWRDGWRPYMEPSQYLSADIDRGGWASLLYRARRVLLDGGRVYVVADGGGREVFRIPLPGGPMILKHGWLGLHRQTGARVLPVTTHLEGRTQVITIHPALPTSGTDRVGDVEAWRKILASLLEDYVRRFPEQCLGLVPQRSGELTAAGMASL
jgi:hypothetical protein